MTAKDSANDFEALMRQYWGAWEQTLRQHGAPAQSESAVPGANGETGWQQALDWWAQLLPETAAPTTREAVERFRSQSGDWLNTMQQVAARLAGRDNTSEQVARAWREAVEGQGERLLQWTLGAGQVGDGVAAEPWLQQTARLFEQWRRESTPWLDMPGLGPGRNHQLRWQTLARAQQEYQDRSQAYAEQLRGALDRAFALFEAKLAEHEAAGTQLTSARALFDLWIEAAEEAYAAVALSEQFQHVYGACANAHMRLRAAVQQEVEQLSESVGIPTRSEMDAAHRRIAELERRLRRVEAGSYRVAGEPCGPRSAASPKPAAKRRAKEPPAPTAKTPAGKIVRPVKAQPRGDRQ